MTTATATALTAEQRVTAGAAFLDQNRPGWDALINRDRLDINSARNCVLGQLDGSYWISPLHLKPDFDGARLGLMCTCAHAIDDPENWLDLEAFLTVFDHCDADALTAAWRNLITQRRAAA